MAQPQHQTPQIPPQPARPFSPAQNMTSPNLPQSGFVMPPNKRPRLGSGSPPQARSPFPASPYPSNAEASAVQSPASLTSPPAAYSPAPSPLTQPLPPPQHPSTPYATTNGASPAGSQPQPLLQPSHQQAQRQQQLQQPSQPQLQKLQVPTPSTVALPHNSSNNLSHHPSPSSSETRPPALTVNRPISPATNNAQYPLQPPPPPTPGSSLTPSSYAQQSPQPLHQPQATQPIPALQYTTATMSPIVSGVTGALGAMGPPQKPVDRPTADRPPVKELEYDVGDALAGTGIDIRAEEQYMVDYYAGSFGADSRTGLPANPPGDRASFYGAGFANTPARPPDSESEDKNATKAAEKAWFEASHRLAKSRANEVKNPFLQLSILHHRAEKIAREHGLILNKDPKNPQGLGKMLNPDNFPSLRVVVSTKLGPNGAMVMTTGSFIPNDAYLSDQFALLSLACKHRLTQLMEDANTAALIRQKTAHGEVPAEWADVASPLAHGIVAGLEQDLISPHSTLDSSGPSPLTATNPHKRSHDVVANSDAPTVTLSQPANGLTLTLRETGHEEREDEESRLKKRQKRISPDKTPAPSRAGSVGPGATVAPEPENRPPTKKELKKGAAAAKAAAEASSTTSTNQTVAQFMGGFGRKKKSYSWMTSSPTSTPGPSRLGTPGAASGPAAARVAARASEKASLTSMGRYRHGAFREDGDKGKDIQLRDWVVALEIDGHVPKNLQAAYARLESLNAKPI